MPSINPMTSDLFLSIRSATLFRCVRELREKRRLCYLHVWTAELRYGVSGAGVVQHQRTKGGGEKR